MSDSVFWLIVSICFVILGIMFMLYGWGTAPNGGWGWFCTLGLFVILTGAILAGATAEAKGDEEDEE
jgi:uncharacterized membrane protein HdeD (DUF308 family)